MNQRAKKEVGNIRKLYFLLLLSIFIFATISATIGIANITWRDTFEILGAKLFGLEVSPHISSSTQMIILQLRMPRIVMALLAGANLAITGAIYQAIFRNDMADPYMLGISSGASLGAGIGFLVGGFSPIYAFVGALIANFIVIHLSAVKQGVSTIRLLLSGIAINYFFSSILSLMRTYSQDRNLVLFAWGMGSLGAASWTRVWILAAVSVPIVWVLYFLRKELNLLLMGEEAAKSLGVNVSLVRGVLLFLSSILIATTVAFTGTIGFVGLIIPHMVRLKLGHNYQKTLPFTMLFGMAFLLFCDNLSRALFANGEIPIGIITSLFGAPYFMYLINQDRKRGRG
jgi:iron complex transport system permease protein